MSIELKARTILDPEERLLSREVGSPDPNNFYVELCYEQIEGERTPVIRIFPELSYAERRREIGDKFSLMLGVRGINRMPLEGALYGMLVTSGIGQTDDFDENYFRTSRFFIDPEDSKLVERLLENYQDWIPDSKSGNPADFKYA